MQAIQPCTIRRILPARCEAEWVQLPARPGQVGTATINGVPYQVQSLLSVHGRDGVRFTNPKGIHRDVDLTGSVPHCDCPDYQGRRINTDGKCKHVLAIEQLDAEARELKRKLAEARALCLADYGVA